MYNSKCRCGSGGTGRRARLRGVWFYRTGSIPVSRTKNKRRMGYILRLFFIQTAGLVWNQRAPRVVWNYDEVAHGIARSAYRIKLLRLDAIHGVAVIPFRPLV